MTTNEAIVSRLASLTRLESLSHDLLFSLADLGQLVRDLQAEREQLRKRVGELQAECERLGAERSQFLHAWADLAVPEEELARSSQQPGGGPLSELLQRLEKA